MSRVKEKDPTVAQLLKEPLIGGRLETLLGQLVLDEKIVTLSDFEQLSWIDLYKMPNVGRSTIRELKHVLGLYGYKLKHTQAELSEIGVLKAKLAHAHSLNEKLLKKLRAWDKIRRQVKSLLTNKNGG